MKFDLLEPQLERWRSREAPLIAPSGRPRYTEEVLSRWEELQVIDRVACITNAPEGVIRLCSCWRVAKVVAACDSSY
jgi:hypothetical protein